MPLAEPAAPAPPKEDSRSLAFAILVGGTRLNGVEIDNLVGVEVDTAVNRPDLCLLSFRPLLAGDGLEQPSLPPSWKPGAAVEVELQGTSLFDGEVTAVDYEYVAGATTVVLTAHDKRHRLYRMQHLASFVNVSCGDVVKKVAQNAGVPAAVSPRLATTVHPYLVHPECSMGEWCEQLLGEVGAVMLWKDKRLWAGPLDDHRPPAVAIRFSAEVDRYRFRATCDGQHTEVVVRGWDRARKMPVTGRAASSVGRGARVPAGSAAPPIAATVDGVGLGDAYRIRSAVTTPAEADALARAISTFQLDATAQLEARTIGNRSLRAGGLISVEQVPTQFAGTYRLSWVRHLYQDGEYWTELSCHGAGDATSVAALASPGGTAGARAPAPRLTSVAVGIVTNVKDPDNLGRVKVKLPWLPSAADIESGWMRVATPGAGPERGLFWLPEINDEVLVAFEHGDIRHGYVLGGLYNSKDKPPLPTSAAVAGDGSVAQRAIKTRRGHTLLLDDSTDKPGIELVTQSGKLKLTLDDKDFDFKLESGRHVIVDNKGDLTVTTAGNIEIEAAGNLKLTGNQVTIEAKSNLEVKAAANAKVAANASLELTGAAQAKLSGSGGTEVSSPAITQVKGSLVKIN